MNELDKLYEMLKDADDEDIMEIYQLIKKIERGQKIESGPEEISQEEN